MRKYAICGDCGRYLRLPLVPGPVDSFRSIEEAQLFDSPRKALWALLRNERERQSGIGTHTAEIVAVDIETETTREIVPLSGQDFSQFSGFAVGIPWGPGGYAPDDHILLTASMDVAYARSAYCVYDTFSEAAGALLRSHRGWSDVTIFGIREVPGETTYKITPLS